VDTPVKQLGGNITLYYKMLEKLEKMSLNNNMKEIAKAVGNQNWL